MSPGQARKSADVSTLVTGPNRPMAAIRSDPPSGPSASQDDAEDIARPSASGPSSTSGTETNAWSRCARVPRRPESRPRPLRGGSDPADRQGRSTTRRSRDEETGSSQGIRGSAVPSATVHRREHSAGRYRVRHGRYREFPHAVGSPCPPPAATGCPGWSPSAPRRARRRRCAWGPPAHRRRAHDECSTSRNRDRSSAWPDPTAGPARMMIARRDWARRYRLLLSKWCWMVSPETGHWILRSSARPAEHMSLRRNLGYEKSTRLALRQNRLPDLNNAKAGSSATCWASPARAVVRTVPDPADEGPGSGTIGILRLMIGQTIAAALYPPAVSSVTADGAGPCMAARAVLAAPACAVTLPKGSRSICHG